MNQNSPREERILEIVARLNKEYPDADCELTYENPLQLLIAVILSAQCTDVMVNRVTPGLFAQFPTIKSLATADLVDVEKAIGSINFFRNKSKNIIGTAKNILSIFEGEVPSSLEDLIRLPGVGRKTANVVLGQAFGKPGITVDTHVKRVSTRLGFTKEKDATKIEFDLMKKWPKSIWSNFSTVLILHGRHTCKSQTPLCLSCNLKTDCPASL